MGNITSGVRGSRGGKPACDCLPYVSLKIADMWRVKQRPAHVVVDGPTNGTVIYGMMQWPVDIVETPLHYGGHRRWLVCGGCFSRRVALYIHDSQLACRTCFGLRYGSQHEGARDRAFRRADAIRARLGWQAGIAHPNGTKPHGMHRKTFQRLVAEHDAIAAYLLGDVSKWLDRAEIRLSSSVRQSCTNKD